MKIDLPLPQEKKLTVLFRVEPGCLGPSGNDHIVEFCKHAQIAIENIDADYIHWEIVPRHDKSLAEIQYKINNKNLTHDQAAKYLDKFSKNLDEFEEHFHEKIISLIEKYTKS